MPEDPRINDRPLQWRDLSNRGRKIVSDNIRQTGVDLPKIALESAERLQATHERTGNAKARVQARSMREVAPHLQSKPVTLQTAANARDRLYDRGIADRRAEHPDDPHQVTPTGAGWYFEHHREIASSAEKHGVPRDWAIAASGVMSPQNSPENERAAVSALIEANAKHTVKVTPEVHDHLAKNNIDVSEHLGKTVGVDQLPAGSLAHLSDKRIADKVETGANLKDIARGGVRNNTVKAERILAGEIHPDDAVNPHSAPKVWSYVNNTRQAVPGSATHVEYMGRVHQDALVRQGQIDKHQQALDLYGFEDQKVPDNHLLSQHSHTVEDTWQNAASFDQPKTMAQGKTSVFKAAGSMPETYPVRGIKTTINPETGKRETAHPDARVQPSSLTHAFNNRATQKAAEQRGRASGTSLPPAAVQEVGWVQMRKDAGKDPEYNQRKAPTEDRHEGEVKGQQALFSMEDRAGRVRGSIPGGERVRQPLRSNVVEDPYAAAPDLTPSQMERDLRAHEAIARTRRAKDRRLRGRG